MSNSSRSPVDLPIAPLPLTSQQRDELDRAILKRLSDLLPGPDEIPDQTHIVFTMELKDWLCRSIVREIIQETSYFLKRENIKNTLRVDIDMKNEGTLQEHPQLRDIIREVCQTRLNFTRIADLSECFVHSSTYIPRPDSCRRNISDIRIGKHSHALGSRSETFMMFYPGLHF